MADIQKPYPSLAVGDKADIDFNHFADNIVNNISNSGRRKMQEIITKDPNFVIRHATLNDAALIVKYMKKLGAYQKMADEITATEPQIKRLLGEGIGEAVFGVYKGKIVGFVYFCMKSSAFTGRSGLYIDGFLVDEKMRHKGYGKILMGYLCRLALDRNCQMLEWGCLDWNAPTIEFYRKLGAYSLDSMTIFRFAPEELHTNALLFENG
jgi:GNAT superfamily N-acetyltransferase